MPSNVNIRSILDNNKLTRPNFLDCFRNLKIVLKVENIAYVLNRSLPQSPLTNACAYEKHVANSEIASCIMLASMTTKI